MRCLRKVMGRASVTAISRIHDPAGGDVEVTLQPMGDGLYIFGPDGNRMHRWPYAEIVNVLPDNGVWRICLRIAIDPKSS